MNERILIFEDEPAIAENLVYALQSEGRPRRAAAPRAGFLPAKADLVVLDVVCPTWTGSTSAGGSARARPCPSSF
jgi:DNA-binding response OmpR family regulator